MNVKNHILGIISDVLDVKNINEENINENLNTFGLDSIKFIGLIVTLEDEFDIEIPDNILMMQELDTPQKIIAIVESLVNE